MIRPIEAGDRHALARGHGQLSTRSQFNRYLAFKPQLSGRELDYLTQIDQRDHAAFVAIDPSAGHAIVGVARYVRIAPGIAEPAIVIADQWQRRGLARHLLGALVKRAQDAGIRRFDASALAGNREAISVLTRLGPTTQNDFGDEVELQIELPLPEPSPPAA